MRCCRWRDIQKRFKLLSTSELLLALFLHLVCVTTKQTENVSTKSHHTIMNDAGLDSSLSNKEYEGVQHLHQIPYYYYSNAKNVVRTVSIPITPNSEITERNRRRLQQVRTSSRSWRVEDFTEDSWRPHQYPRRRGGNSSHKHQDENNGLSTLKGNFTFRDHATLNLDERRLVANDLNNTGDGNDDTERISSDRQIVSLYQGYGTHYADIWCGTPPQRQTVIVDTGSTTTAFPCSDCVKPLTDSERQSNNKNTNNCGHENRADNFFNEHKSGTFLKLQCSDCFLGECTKTAIRTTTSGSSIVSKLLRSKIIESEECKFGISYHEGSNWEAFEAVDVCYVGGFHNVPVSPTVKNHKSDSRTKHYLDHGNDKGVAKIDDYYENNFGLDPAHASNFRFNLRFGCQTQMSGHFETQLEGGIMGLDIGKPSIWNQMYLSGTISSRSFSLCFTRQRRARKDGTEAGAMTFGGTDTRLHLNEMVYSSIDKKDNNGFFSVHVRKVYLREGAGEADGYSINTNRTDLRLIQLNVSESQINKGGVIIDSGTTDTYFIEHLGAPFRKAWKELVNVDYTNRAIPLTAYELSLRPTIILQLKGGSINRKIQEQYMRESFSSRKNHLPLANAIDPAHPTDILIAIPPTHYYEYQEDSRRYIPGIYLEELEGSVLGANVMMMHEIYFDVDHFRIGWTESHCNYSKLVSANIIDKDYPATHVTIQTQREITLTEQMISSVKTLVLLLVCVAAGVIIGSFYSRISRYNVAPRSKARKSIVSTDPDFDEPVLGLRRHNSLSKRWVTRSRSSHV